MHLLTNAVTRDPGFSLAHATLSLTCANRYFEFEPATKWLDKAEFHCGRALELNRDLSEAHVAKAFLLWSPSKNFQHLDAIAELRKAISLQKNLPHAYNRLATILAHIGLLDRAEMCERGRPFRPQKAVSHSIVQVHVWSGEIALAQEEIQRWRAENSTNKYAIYFAPQATMMAGDWQEAKALLDEAIHLAKPNAQKLFRFQKRYAVACFGNAFVNQKSMQAQIRELEGHLGDTTNVDTVADKFVLHFEKQLLQEIKDLNRLPKGSIAFGFQVCGADLDGVLKTWAVHIGNPCTKKAESQFGTTMSGDVALVGKLAQATGGVQQLQPNFQTFSLGDAMEFVQFLIKFVADYQRFSSMIPTVGGKIDIAIVTNYSGFTWIHQKPLAKLMEVHRE